MIIRQNELNSVMNYKYCVAEYDNIPQMMSPVRSEYTGSVGVSDQAVSHDCCFC